MICHFKLARTSSQLSIIFLKWIKKEMTVQKLMKVVYNGDKNITQLVIDMEDI
jgi:hypothetical protein